MTASGHGPSGPGQARQIVDELEAAVEADAEHADAEHASGVPATGDDVHGDWVPEVPGSGEPPD